MANRNDMDQVSPDLGHGPALCHAFASEMVMKVSLVQLNAQGDKAANLAAADHLVRRAVERERPDMIALPEMFCFMAEGSAPKQANAERLPDGAAYRWLRDTAIRHRVFLHGGSLIETDGERLYNTTVAFGPDGQELARYRKIHLFDVTTPDGREYRESATFSAGHDVVTYQAGEFRIGCSICYDLRFPELYQALARAGAHVLMVPAAFTLLTGKDHWDVLLRARAIETQTYVVAPAQYGTFANGTRANYGHSLVADPWGLVIARASDGPGSVTACLDLDYLKSVRAKIPVASHKVIT